MREEERTGGGSIKGFMRSKCREKEGRRKEKSEARSEGRREERVNISKISMQQARRKEARKEQKGRREVCL